MLDLFVVLFWVLTFGGFISSCVFAYLSDKHENARFGIYEILFVVSIIVCVFPFTCDNSMKQTVLYVYDVQEVQDLPKADSVKEAIENISFLYDVNSEKELSSEEATQIAKYLVDAYQAEYGLGNVIPVDIHQDNCVSNFHDGHLCLYGAMVYGCDKDGYTNVKDIIKDTLRLVRASDRYINHGEDYCSDSHHDWLKSTISNSKYLQ